MIKRYTICLLIITNTLSSSFAEEAGIPRINNTVLEEMITSAISQKFFPGAQVVVGDKEGIIYSKSFGYLDYSKSSKVVPEDVYDVASCTKVISTTIAVMKLVSEGELTLTDNVESKVFRFKDTPIGKITLKEMLNHTSGLKAAIPVVAELVKADSGETLLSSVPKTTHPHKFDNKVYVNKKLNYDTTYISFCPKEGYRQISNNRYINPSFDTKIDSMVLGSFDETRRGRYRYSDLNFYLIQQMVETTAMESLDNYMAKIYNKMGLKNIGYTPLKWTERDKIAPTEYDPILRQDTVRGFVHDELAALLGGISGHAGLFSNAESMAALCQMFLAKGMYNNTQIIKSDIIEQFTSMSISGRSFRGLGFDKQNSETTKYSSSSYGHSGFTGTYFWVDPDSNRYLIILTNRVNPSRANKKYTTDLRQQLWDCTKISR